MPARFVMRTFSSHHDLQGPAPQLTPRVASCTVTLRISRPSEAGLPAARLSGQTTMPSTQVLFLSDRTSTSEMTTPRTVAPSLPMATPAAEKPSSTRPCTITSLAEMSTPRLVPAARGRMRAFLPGRARNTIPGLVMRRAPSSSASPSR